MAKRGSWGIGDELGSFGLIPGTRPGVLEELDHDFDIPYSFHPDNISLELGNQSLPVFDHKAEILESVRNNPVTIIVAETGAGKSTQIPQYLLEAGYENVYLTQPRRTAAANVFFRLLSEIGDVYGKYGAEELVSFQTAGDRTGPDDARVKVVTDGLQLVKELHFKGIEENDVLIIDEAHEWNSNIEILTAWTKQAIKENPNLRVVITSATMDAEHLAEYYSDVSDQPPPIITIDGRRHKVEFNEEPNSTAADKVIELISTRIALEDGTVPEDNDILLFEPGKREIIDVLQEIKRRLPKGFENKVKLFPLHAKMSKDEQQKAIAKYPGFLRIIAATDVAQTSLTIEGIKYVVDTGYHRQMEIDHEGTPGLVLSPISQAECMQRAGRTGRIFDGEYYLVRLNDKTPHELFAARDRYPIPEIIRTDISRNTLRLKELGMEMHEFDMYHKASKMIIDLAEKNLKIIDALDDDLQITILGREMNQYPLKASSARIMHEARKYNESIRLWVSAIVSAKEAGGLQYYVPNVQRRWDALTDETAADLLVQLDLYIASQHMTMPQLRDYDIDIDNFVRTQEYFAKVARLAGATPGILQPPTEEERELIKQCIYPGYLNSIYRHVGDGQYQHAFNGTKTLREISNRSCITSRPDFVVGDPYRIELIDNGDTTTRQCIESVTAVTSQSLGRLATHYLDWAPDGFEFREGKPIEKLRQTLFGVDIGITREVSPGSSPQLRQAIMQEVIDHPGYAQAQLKKTKAELERLSRLAKGYVPVITQNQYLSLIEEAAPEGVLFPSDVEDNLQQILYDEGRKLQLDAIVSPEHRQYIEDNAPATIITDGVTLHLGYNQKGVVARRYNLEQVLALTEEVYLPDDRQVLFARKNDSKLYTLLQLKVVASQDL